MVQYKPTVSVGGPQLFLDWRKEMYGGAFSPSSLVPAIWREFMVKDIAFGGHSCESKFFIGQQ
jgi:hypothetical protein